MESNDLVHLFYLNFLYDHVFFKAKMAMEIYLPLKETVLASQKETRAESFTERPVL